MWFFKNFRFFFFSIEMIRKYFFFFWEEIIIKEKILGTLVSLIKSFEQLELFVLKFLSLLLKGYKFLCNSIFFLKIIVHILFKIFLIA